jgi:hypothetical protein
VSFESRSVHVYLRTAFIISQIFIVVVVLLTLGNAKPQQQQKEVSEGGEL